MKDKYKFYLIFLVDIAKKANKVKEDKIEFGQRTLLDSIRTFFEYKTQKTVQDTLNYFYQEGYLVPSNGGFVVSDKMKLELW